MSYKHIPGKEIMALGFGFGLANNLIDKGVDPRQYEVPSVLEEWNKIRDTYATILPPISIAPKDGTPFLGLLRDGPVPYAVVKYDPSFEEASGEEEGEGCSGFIVAINNDPVEVYGGCEGWHPLPGMQAIEEKDNGQES